VTTLAFHVDQLYYPVPGGIGTYVRKLVPALADADPSLDIGLFHARFEPRTPGEGGAGPVPPERWMRGFWSEELRDGIAGLYPRWAALGRPRLPASIASRDVLHTPSPSAVPPPGPAQRLVVTVHDLAFLVHGDLFPPAWRVMFRAGLRRAVRSADALIAVSRHTAEDLVRLTKADPARVHVTPLAPALPDAGADVEKVLARLRIEPPYILFNGTLERRKNVTRLVRAYRRLVGRGAPHALVLAGALGWRPQALLAEIGAEAPGRILVTGAVSVADLDALYRGAAAFAYPSLYEGFGLPVMDAMARGVPCVVSTASSLPEVAGDAALLADPLSVGSIAEALERITSDEGLAATLSAAGRERAGQLSWERTARATLDVYGSLG
jgi:glycosyltransferase involved in cell wall biosynthesis